MTPLKGFRGEEQLSAVGKRMMEEKPACSELIRISKRYFAWECDLVEIIRSGKNRI
jgi:hypothetical protein